MIDGHKTKREKKFEERRIKVDEDTLKITVVNKQIIEFGKVLSVSKPFYNIESALHKIKLDILTNAHHGIKLPIEIYVEAEHGRKDA